MCGTIPPAIATHVAMQGSANYYWPITIIIKVEFSITIQMLIMAGHFMARKYTQSTRNGPFSSAVSPYLELCLGAFCQHFLQIKLENIQARFSLTKTLVSVFQYFCVIKPTAPGKRSFRTSFIESFHHCLIKKTELLKQVIIPTPWLKRLRVTASRVSMSYSYICTMAGGSKDRIKSTFIC